MRGHNNIKDQSLPKLMDSACWGILKNPRSKPTQSHQKYHMIAKSGPGMKRHVKGQAAHERVVPLKGPANADQIDRTADRQI